MALRFLESFDHYATAQIGTKGYGVGVSWTIEAAAARTGIQGVTFTAFSGRLDLTLDAQGTWVIGLAVRGFTAPGILANTVDTASKQGRLTLDAARRLELRRGNTVVATSVNSLLNGVYYYIEFKHIIDNVAGLLEVRVDGVVWATFNGDTQATANATANIISFGRHAIGDDDCAQSSMDDVYILDGVDQSIADPNSPPNNDYWGDTQVQALVPVGAGAYAELATLFGAPTHWQAEDEVPPDEDTSYVEDAVVDRRDTFAMTNLAVVSATIPGIQILTRARKTAAGAANFARLYRNAAADNQGIDTVLQESYAYHREIMGGDPIAAGAWVVAAINSMEMGFRIR